MFKKLAEISPVLWGVLAALAVIALVLYVSNRSKTRWSARLIANAALTIALSFVLSYIRLYKMPQGGSITLASMLPIFMFSYAYGAGPGLFVGLAYGFLQWMQDGFYMLTPVEGVLDYLLAFALLGLSGLTGNLPEKWRLPIGCIFGAVGRAVCAIISGYVFFGSYAPEGQSAILYSITYNGLYLVPETAICIALACIPQIRALTKRLALSK